MPTVAISAEFLEAFAKIPKAQQKKVRAFTEKFQANPKSSAINYEKIGSSKRLSPGRDLSGGANAKGRSERLRESP